MNKKLVILSIILIIIITAFSVGAGEKIRIATYEDDVFSFGGLRYEGDDWNYIDHGDVNWKAYVGADEISEKEFLDKVGLKEKAQVVE